MPLLSAGLGRKIDGIIGGEFIKQFVLELDYQARSIRLHDRQTFRYAGPGETLPIEFTPDGHPIVAATLTPLGGTPIQHRFLLDVGSGLALVIHSPFVAQHNLLGRRRPHDQSHRHGRCGWGVGRAPRTSGRVADRLIQDRQPDRALFPTTRPAPSPTPRSPATSARRSPAGSGSSSTTVGTA